MRTLSRSLLAAGAFLCLGAGIAPAVILYDTGDPTVNASTPGDNSGWQYEGQFGGFIGTPIAPYYFMTAQHIGGGISQSFTFHGETFTTTAVFNDPSTDLRIWQVDHPFATYAPLFQVNGDETSQELHVFGRGTQRGSAISLDGKLRGWAWGASDGVQRWGRNVVADIVPYSSGSPWTFLQATFDSNGLVHEAHLSVGDSGGGVFILENGLWCLAGINYGVDEIFTAPDSSSGLIAAIFDATGYYVQRTSPSGTTYPQIPPNPDGSNVPTSFYSTQVSARMSWIAGVLKSNSSPLPTDPSVLPAESFASWEHGYFTPSDIANSAVSGPGADPDGDGIPNLLEFAFNLDPTFPEPVVMTAGTGLRGLPLIQVEQVSGTDRRLTVEFVRRTSASGSGINYAVQFATSLGADATWAPGGTESVTAISARWERVKVTDSLSAGNGTPVRFARVAVSQM